MDQRPPFSPGYHAILVDVVWQYVPTTETKKRLDAEKAAAEMAAQLRSADEALISLYEEGRQRDEVNAQQDKAIISLFEGGVTP